MLYHVIIATVASVEIDYALRARLGSLTARICARLCKDSIFEMIL